MASRREKLDSANAAGSTHLGLWLDRFVEDLDTHAARHTDALFVEKGGKPRALAIETPEGYLEFYRRLELELRRLEPLTLVGEARATGRLAVGLGGETVLETAIALHRTWGVPYIPGSALKGLAARAARQNLDPPWQKDSKEYRLLFGELENAGYVTFHDALWKPFRVSKGKKGQPDELVRQSELPILQDVMTVHHRDYYGWNGTGQPAPPADWDDPNPVPFLTAQGTYLVALTGPPGWVELAFEILAGALKNDGIGAKTAAGYGRMELKRL